jgi:hypothetical protein
VGVVTSMVATLTVRDPAISVQPVNQTNSVGETARFSVTAVGSGTIRYEWMRDGVTLADGPTGWGSVIAGASTDTLSIVGVTPADANTNYVVIVAGVGVPECSTNSVTSSARSLTVLTPPTITVSGNPASGITLGWPTMVGKYYEVFYATDLGAPVWFSIYSWQGDGLPAAFTDFPPSSDPQRFYRILMQ